MLTLVPSPAPIGSPPIFVQRWFDDAASAMTPEYAGTLATSCGAGEAYAFRAKADNTRRAYRAGVRAWCSWCDTHGLPYLPARAEDVVLFLAMERGRGMSLNTIDLRRAAIRHLHFITGCPIRNVSAKVAEAVLGMRREAADRHEEPDKKLAATAQILREIVVLICDDLPGLRDKALLTVGFAGVLRRSELAAIISRKPPSPLLSLAVQRSTAGRLHES